MAWGFKPEAVVGYGLGEWVAATIAGVVSVEDALTIVGKVGGLIQSLPAGEMLAVDLSEQEVRTHLGDQLSLAAITGPQQCIVSGPSAAINSLMNTLRASQVTYRRQFSTRAFHSSMIDAILPEVRQLVAKASFNQPEILFLSLRTGKPMTDQAADPATWVDQWRDPVLFAAGMTELFQEPDRIFIEVGPERILTTLANRLPARQVSHLVLPTMRHPLESIGGIQILLTSIGRLWLQGVDVDWEAYSADWVRGRVSLPPSPFEKSRHWIDAPKVRWRSRTILEIASDEDSQDVMSAEEGADARNHLSTSFVAPRDELETEISQMWAKGLGIDRVGIQDNFFEMGGDSLLAIGLLSTLGKRFGVPLPSHAMVQHQSVASMAELIRQSAANLGEAESDSALVEIQRGQPQFPPLYMVHPIGGDIYFYRDLAKRLSTSQPVYAFQARSLSGDVPPFDDIQKQASAYLEDLLEKQAHGPYLLGGSSYGGLVAYEMARQLTEQGEEVPLVVLVDTPAPGAMPGKTEGYAEILDYLLGDQLNLDQAVMSGLAPEDQLDYVFEVARSSNRVDVLPPTFGVPMLNTWLAHQDAMHAYQPVPYDGRVIFFRPTEIMKLHNMNMHLPWIDLVRGGIEIHRVPGNHISMNFMPNIKVLAAHLELAIESATLGVR